MSLPPLRREAGPAAPRYVYAALSRRARGLSLGINLNPDRACTFDCPYCQVDRTDVPERDPRMDLARLGAELREALLALREGRAPATLLHGRVPDGRAPELADIAFAGDGEPTAAREFPQAVDLARALRDELAPGVPLRLLTNGAHLTRPSVQAALEGIDEAWVKLDAGEQAAFERASGTKRPLGAILEGLLRLARQRPVVVQSLFFRWEGRGPTEAELAAWRARLAELLAAGARLARVQVYTVARRPAAHAVSPLEPEALERIAREARALGLDVEVFA